LASCLAVLAEAAREHAERPELLHEVADRVAFRIRATEDIFRFLPSKAGLPFGGGTLWGLICESPPLVAGVLIRRLFVERVGEDFPLTEVQTDQVMWSLGEQSRNVGLLELVSRCPSARSLYGQRGMLGHAIQALELTRGFVLQAPASRTETDRAFMSTTAGVYGMCDGDANFFREPDFFRSILEVLLCRDCQAWPAAALRKTDDFGEAIRRASLLTLEIGGRLTAFPAVIARAYAFLSSVVYQAFIPASAGNTSAGEGLWIIVDVLAASEVGNFAEAVLEVGRKNRLHSPSDVLEAREELFARRRPDGDGGRLGRGRGHAPDAARLAVCHVLLLLLRLCKLSQHLGGQPESFRHRALASLSASCRPC
ncbi:unnamed protein product, partial [Polarella glacialis]